MKRRFFAMLLSLAMLFTLAPTAFAAGNGSQPTEGTCGATESDKVSWKLEQNNSGGENPTYTLTISGSGKMENFTSPTAENPNIAPWYTALPADENTSSVPITEIKIEEGVTDLSNYAFSYLTNVVKANIPASITSLGDSIFRGDTALTTVEWASGFNAPEIRDTDSKDDIYRGKYVPTSMFDGCTSLGKDKELSAWLPASFTGVGCAAFRGTQFTVDFNGWNKLKYIGAYGFAGMPNLDSFTLSNEITLGLRGGASNAFNSSGLKTLTVADGIKAIPNGMFNGCEQLLSVALADSVTTISTNAFFNTKALEKINLKNVQTINSYAFWGSGLTDLVLPESVKQVKERAFEACTSLKKVTINAAELALENKNTFAGCSSLNTVVTSAGSKIEHLNANAFGPDTSYGSKDYKQAPVKSIEINGTVTTLNFSALSSLTSLTINGQNTWSGNELPSEFENLVINGDNWNISGYQFAGKMPIKHLVVSANAVSPAVISDNTNTKKTEAAFRSNSNLETAQFTGKTVELQNKMFLGCTKLKWLDLSTVDELKVGSGCFGDDNNENYEVVKGEPNKFNEDCVIYAKNATAAQTLRDNLGTKGIVLVVNGGSVDATKTGFAAVSRAGYSVTWASSNGTTVAKPETATLISGETYTATWKLLDNNVEITYKPNISGGNDKDVVRVAVKGADTTVASALFSRTGYTFAGWNTNADGTGTAYKIGDTIKADTMMLYAQWTLDKPTISSSGTTTAVYGNEVTLTASTAATGASYQWYKGDTEIPKATTNTNSLTLTNVADSGAYTVKITVGTDTATSEPTTVTITKATPTIDISATPGTLTGSGTVKLTVTPNGVPTEGKIEVTCDNGITVNNDGGTFTATLPNETKTYTFTASYAGDDNHNNATATCKVSVTHRSSGSSSGSSTTTSNSVSASTASNGKVSLDKSTAKKGDTVTVTVTPDAGYQLDKLTVTDKDGKELKLTDKGDGKYSFTMPDGKVEVKAVFAKKVETSPFDDVSADAYYNQAVQWAQEKGITDGISSNLFGPKQPCTRSQIVTFLWRAAGSPEPKGTAAGMTDVAPGSYYEKAVAWAVENGITTGTAEGTFSPDATCTRAQAVTFLARAQNAKATGKTAFSDVPADSYFADAVAWAQANGVTTGTSETTFSPDSDCTRAQIVTFLYRANQGT